MDGQAADKYTTIIVEAENRIGLLTALTSTFRDLGLEVSGVVLRVTGGEWCGVSCHWRGVLWCCVSLEVSGVVLRVTGGERCGVSCHWRGVVWCCMSLVSYHKPSWDCMLMRNRCVRFPEMHKRC